MCRGIWLCIRAIRAGNWRSRRLCSWARLEVHKFVICRTKIGNFEPRKLFDALLIDVGGNDNINIKGWEGDDLALLKKWVFLGNDRSIRKVFVNGVLVSGKDK